jgi:ADP-ribose pyrophosphatase YjhB (NUDIX family)
MILMRWLPHLTVACIVEERSNGQIVLNQPAGHLEKNETLTAAAIRETLEESACEIELGSILGFYSHYAKESDITYFRVCYRAKLLKEHKYLKLDADIIRTVWLSPEDALKEQHRFRSPFVKTCIEDYIKNQSFPLTLINELPSA